MRIPGFGRDNKEKEAQRDFRHGMMIAHAQRPSMDVSQKQMIDSMGRSFFLQQDENVVEVLQTYCPELIPAFSRLNATSKIEKPRDRQIMELYLEDILLHAEMELGDEGDVQARNLLRSLHMFGNYRILDTLGGYRGKLVTEEIERHQHTFEEQKRKPLL